MFILPSCNATHIAEDVLSSSTIILSTEARLFCGTSEVAFHILISYEAMQHMQTQKSPLVVRQRLFSSGFRDNQGSQSLKIMTCKLSSYPP